MTPCYENVGDALAPFDDGAAWTHRRPFPDGDAGLLSTVGGYLKFATLLLDRGVHDGVRLLAPELVSLMTTDHLSAEQRANAGPILDGRGRGFGLSMLRAAEGRPGPKGYGWSGGSGTVWVNDPDEDLTAVLCTEMLLSEAGLAVERDFWDAVYAALGNRSVV